MKKSLFYIGVSLVVLSSCAKEIEQIKEDKIDIINEENPIQGPSKESVVIYGEVNTTKTTVDGSGIFAWQTGEKIAVVEQDMTDSDGLGFTLSDASTGAFTGTKTDGKDLVFAVSPQSALSEASESTGDVLYSLTLPATYSNYVSGTTNDIMVGTPDPGYSGDGYKFIFRQATALLKFTYANVPYGTKKFKLTTPEYITGEWLFDTTSGVSLDQTSSGGKTVTITLASTVEAVGQTMTFCVPVPAGNYTGFDIELQDAEGNTLTGTDKSKSGLNIDLVAGDIFICRERVVFWGMMDSLRGKDYPLNPLGELYPVTLTAEQRAIIMSELNRAAQALHIVFSAINIEIVIGPDGDVYFIELNPRNGGNRIPEALHYATGFDIFDATVRAAVGETVEPYENDNSGVTATYMVHSDVLGTLTTISFSDQLKPFIKDFFPDVESGAKVEPFVNSDKRLGVLVMQFDSVSKRDEIISHIKEYINIELS